jgi:hypothetical protein
MSFISFSMNFGTLNDFLEFQNRKRNWRKKNVAQHWAAIWPTTLHRWLSPEGKMASQPPHANCVAA